ncbi:hypothetical protein Hamer_G010932, partial [Homarus americanus]
VQVWRGVLRYSCGDGRVLTIPDVRAGRVVLRRMGDLLVTNEGEGGRGGTMQERTSNEVMRASGRPGGRIRWSAGLSSPEQYTEVAGGGCSSVSCSS